MTMPVGIGDRLKNSRGGTSQKVLARLSGVSQSMISQIETGERPTPGVEVLTALEVALKLPHGFLSAPDSDDASLARYLKSDYAKDQRVTPEEVERLRTVNWKGPTEDAPPAAWAALLEALRIREQRK